MSLRRFLNHQVFAPRRPLKKASTLANAHVSAFADFVAAVLSGAMSRRRVAAVASGSAMRSASVSARPPALLPLTACFVRHARVAVDARTRLVGMSKAKPALCAGLRTRVGQIDPATEMGSDEHKVEGGTVDLTLPIVGGINIGNGAYCHVTFKLS